MRPAPNSNSSKGVAAIVGVGPNLGRSVARKFAMEGYTVAILSRDLGKLSRLADEIACEAKAQVFAIRIDCSDAKSVREAFEGVLSLGFVEVLVYNACQAIPSRPTRFMDTSLESFERSLTVSSVGAFHCAQQVMPGMVERGKGTIIFTGSSASVTGFAGYCELSTMHTYIIILLQYKREIFKITFTRTFPIWGGASMLYSLKFSVPTFLSSHQVSSSKLSLSLSLSLSVVACIFILRDYTNAYVSGGCGKFALRGLSQCLAREFQQAGIHVAHIIIDGAIGKAGRSRVESNEDGESSMDPDILAQTYWYVHAQDKGAWTQEIDLRS